MRAYLIGTAALILTLAVGLVIGSQPASPSKNGEEERTVWICRAYKSVDFGNGICGWYCFECPNTPRGATDNCTAEIGGCGTPGTPGCFEVSRKKDERGIPGIVVDLTNGDSKHKKGGPKFTSIPEPSALGKCRVKEKYLVRFPIPGTKPTRFGYARLALVEAKRDGDDPKTKMRFFGYGVQVRPSGTVNPDFELGSGEVHPVDGTNYVVVLSLGTVNYHVLLDNENTFP